MVTHGTKGAVPIIILLYLGAGLLCTQLVPNWRPSHWFKKGPPVAQVQADEKALAEAKAQLAVVEASAAEAKKAAEANKLLQLRSAQENSQGVAEALSKAPSASKGPEVILAQDLNNRALTGLSLAIGGLPADQQKEISAIVAGALSKVQAERDQALAQLAAKDADLKVATVERQKAEAALPPLQVKEAKLEGTIAAKDADLTKQTAEVVKWTTAKVEEEKKSGSLGALVLTLEHVLLFVGLAYLFIHFALPSLAQEFPACLLLQRVYRFLASVVSSHSINVSK